ncbi:MAG: hypothetical protein NTY76_06335 [Candidatus Omnitrophica bacterium]|nr:hypothetical protein [Candidatus Omnitrophota bacterium]
MFKATIVTPNKVLFDGEAWSVFLPGATGEFEILEMHKAIVSLLRQGNIVINWDIEIPVTSGAVRMSGDELVAIVESD